MEEHEDESVSDEETEEETMIKYTLPQRVFIFKSYCKNESAKICGREFRQAYPDTPPPKKSRIMRLVNNFARTGLLLDVEKIEDKHIKELENEAEENKKRLAAVPSVLGRPAVEDQGSEGETEDISSMIETEIKTEPPSSPEHETGSSRFEFVPIKKEPKEAAVDGEESVSSSNGNEPAIQAPEWGLVEENPESSTVVTSDALPYPCRHCGCCFRTYTDLKSHISEVHAEMVSMNSSNSNEPAAAIQASEWGLVEANPMLSTVVTCDALPYPCRHCGCNFRTYTDLKSHISEMHAEMVRCGECGKEFPTRSKLQRHEAQHAAKPPFTCIECNKEFLSQGKLTSHMKKSHVKSEKSKKEKKVKSHVKSKKHKKEKKAKIKKK